MTLPTPAAPGGWLVRDEFERARLVDMNGRVRTARRIQGASLGAAALLASPWYGWWLSAVVGVALLVLLGLEAMSDRTSRPERLSVTSMALLEIIVAVGVAGTGGARSPLVGFLSVPLVMLAARFRPQVVAVGGLAALVVTSLAFTAAVALPAAPRTPYVVPVVAYLALVTSLVAAVVALLTAELASRGDAVVDPLTGLFNRKGLRGRFEEAAAQARVLQAPLSVVMCDLDHFKDVNDTYGHDRGDIVLREAAYQLRKALRSLDLVYRVGGEEFLVLLPGHDEREALRVAERLVETLGQAPLAGLTVTMSAGSATCRDGGSYESLVRDADTALYAAKAAGRNRALPAGRLAPTASSR